MHPHQPPQTSLGPAGGEIPPYGTAARTLSPFGRPALHKWEIPLLVLVVLLTGFIYIGAIVAVLVGSVNTFVLLFLLAPVALYLARGQTFAAQRVNGVRMSPTQFPEGYRMVAAAAARFGMASPPDAYVVLGNGTINAFASGHGLRRFVVVYSDLFEVGGQARDPDALAFVIGHEVGHIAAGHASYWRQLGMFASPFLPFVGSSLSRAQEYTADNHGLCARPQGSGGAIATLAAGKYLNAVVGLDEFADRAWHERGFFVWLVNALASHPVLTWRANALRDRSRHGKLLWRPKPPQRYTAMPGTDDRYQAPAVSAPDWPRQR